MATKYAPDARVAQSVKGANVQRMFIEEPIIDDLVFGVLRREYKGLINDARAFVCGKLQPMVPAVGVGNSTSSAWAVTATRHEVLLPRDASDTLNDPRRLVELFEDEAPAGQKDLVIALKLTASSGCTLHAFWNRVRDFARTVFVEEHSLPVILAMHDSRLSGTREPTRAHVHLMALPRQLNAFGFGARTTIAVTDAQVALAERWEATC